MAKGELVSKDVNKFKFNIDTEQLLVWNPDFIITTKYTKDTIDSIYSNNTYKDLKAVKNKHIYKMPSYILSWDLPVPESFLGIIWLSNILYGDILGFLHISLLQLVLGCLRELCQSQQVLHHIHYVTYTFLLYPLQMRFLLVFYLEGRSFHR